MFHCFVAQINYLSTYAHMHTNIHKLLPHTATHNSAFLAKLGRWSFINI